MIATVIGSTGLTGSALVRRLVADPAVTRVISVARRPLRISDAKLVEVLVPDLERLPAVESSIRGELYFCCLGTTIKAAGSRENFAKVDHAAVVTFASIAKAHDAMSFTLVSAMGANASSIVFYNRVKGEAERDVRALGLRSLTIFRPALLVGSRAEVRLGEKIATGVLVPLARLFPARTRKRLLTDVDTLATRMLAVGKAAAAGVHVIPAKEI